MFGAARAQGADVEIPSIHTAKEDFDNWLVSDAEPSEAVSGDTLIKRALGLHER